MAETKAVAINEDVEHAEAELIAEGFRICRAGPGSVTCYGKGITGKLKLQVQRIINDVDLTKINSEAEAAAILRTVCPDGAVENYGMLKSTVKHQTGDLSELFKHYPQAMVALVLSGFKDSMEQAKQVLEQANISAWAICKPGEMIYKKTDVKHQALTMVKCVQKAADDGVATVGLTFTTINIDLVKHRICFIDWEDGEQVYCVKQLDLLLPV